MFRVCTKMSVAMSGDVLGAKSLISLPSPAMSSNISIQLKEEEE